MLNSIWEDIQSAFRTGNMVTRLVIVNFGIFVIVNVVKVLLWMLNSGAIPMAFDDGLYWFCAPAHWQEWWRVWSPLTSIFLHEGFWHVIVNIIFLYLFGTIVSDLVGDRRVLPIYLLGGLTGTVLFMVSDFWVHYFPPYALGASGAVMALAGAAVTLAPDYRVMLFLLGEVKLKYVVLVMVLLDLVGMAHNDNTGGHVAHLGGFFFGIYAVSRLRDGHDLLEPVGQFLDGLKKFLPSGKAKQRARTQRKKPEPFFSKNASSEKNTFSGGTKGNAASDNDDLSYQEKLDAILDKIKEHGYENLSQGEKDFLFNASKR